MKKSNPEFENFDAMMRKLISVPHYRIKAALDKEKAEKSRKGKPLASAKKKSAKDRSK